MRVRSRPNPSLGPWTVKEHQERTFMDPADVTWWVVDASGTRVAICEHEADAIHIAQNGPDERVGVTHGKGK